MIKTTAHNPPHVEARQVGDTIWVSALDPDITADRGGDVTIFLSREQAIQLRDEFNAMDLGEPDAKD